MKKLLRAFLRPLAAACGVSLASFAGAAAPVAAPHQPEAPPEWTRIEAAPGEFLGRELQPSCSTLPVPGTDPQFHFWVKRGRVNNLVVYFEGGGACWDGFTCLAQPTYRPFIGPDQNPAAASGIFDLDNPDNPVRDWSFVYIPYCTGDIHGGSKDTAYPHPALPGVEVTIRHRGFDNAMTALKWMTENAGDPHQILVAGSSAGGYGATLHFPWIHDAFPGAKTALMADASNGITVPLWDQAMRDPRWNFQLHPAVFPDGPAGVSGPEIVDRTAARYPHSKFSQYTTAWDSTQVGFFNLMLLTLGQPVPFAQACDAWNGGMLDALENSRLQGNYRSYVAAGTVHTILRAPWFYTESSAGIPFSQWLAGMLRSQGGTHGHGGLPWADVQCADCAKPAACGS